MESSLGAPLKTKTGDKIHYAGVFRWERMTQAKREAQITHSLKWSKGLSLKACLNPQPFYFLED